MPGGPRGEQLSASLPWISGSFYISTAFKPGFAKDIEGVSKISVDNRMLSQANLNRQFEALQF
jgi:hypothetical protein